MQQNLVLEDYSKRQHYVFLPDKNDTEWEQTAKEVAKVIFGEDTKVYFTDEDPSVMTKNKPQSDQNEVDGEHQEQPAPQKPKKVSGGSSSAAKLPEDFQIG